MTTKAVGARQPSEEQPLIAHVATVDLSISALLFNQLLAIQNAGYRVMTISSGPGIPALQAHGIHHHSVPMRRSISPFADLIALLRLARVMRRERCTLVHTHNPKPGLLGQLAAKLAGVPIVVNTVHGFYFHDQMPESRRRFYMAMERLAARCSDAILSQNSEDVRTALRERIARPAQIRYLGNGIDLSLFDPSPYTDDHVRQQLRESLGIPTTARVIGYVGRLARSKGILDLLRATERVLPRVANAHLLVIGAADPSDPDPVHPNESRISPGRVTFLGWQPSAELPRLYALMDVFVLPSKREGFPRAVMEATAMGVPVIASNVRGNREAVETRRNGLFVPWGDQEVLTDALVRMLVDDSLRSQLAARCRQLALERFDERRVFATVLEEYRHLFASRPSATAVHSRESAWPAG